MIECTSCQTLNPDAERVCLACGVALLRPGSPTGVSTMGMARCAAGHPIDPSWKSCPYCERLQEAGGTQQALRSTRLEGAVAEPGPRRTRLEGEVPELPGAERRTRLEGENPWPEPSFSPSSPGPRPTRLEEPIEPANVRRTVLQESPPVAGPVGAAGRDSSPPNPSTAGTVGVAAAARRLVGVLAAPDLGVGGMVFPVRAGKNAIGADRACEIVLAGDGEVSREHAVILHRNGAFHLADRFSTNGTWVNGREVPANGTVPIQDRDRIRCGKTELVFLVIDSEGESPAGAGGEAINV